MLIVIDVPDSARPAVEKCAEWYGETETHLSSAGVVMVIAPGNDVSDRKLAVRVTGFGVLEGDTGAA